MKLKDFISTTFNNVRSSKRTKILHEAVVEYLCDQRHDLVNYDVKYEYKIPDSWGGTFKVDIAFLHNGLVKKVALCKALNSNINKNIKNYANTTTGEASRIYCIDNDINEIIFVTVLPERAPVFDTDGVVKRLDDVVAAKKYTNISNVIEAQYNDCVKLIDIWYKIPNIESRANRKDYANFTPITSW